MKKIVWQNLVSHTSPSVKTLLMEIFDYFFYWLVFWTKMEAGGLFMGNSFWSQICNLLYMNINVLTFDFLLVQGSSSLSQLNKRSFISIDLKQPCFQGSFFHGPKILQS